MRQFLQLHNSKTLGQLIYFCRIELNFQVKVLWWMSRNISWAGPIFHFCLLLFKFLHFCLHYSLIHVCTLFSFSWAAATWGRKNRKRKRKIKITIYEVGVARIHLRWFFNSLQSYWHDDDCQASIFGKVTCYVTSSKNDAIFGQK